MSSTSKRAGASALALLCVVALLVACAAGPAVAATEEDDSDLLFKITESASNTDLSAATTGFLGGRLSSAAGWIDKWSRIATGDTPNATAEADELQAFVNENDASLINHTNIVLSEYNASVRNTTYVLEYTVDGVDEDESDTRYLVVTADGENITDAHVQPTAPENHSVDRSHTIGVFEAEDLNADLRTYHDEFVATGDIPSLQYYINKGAQYGAVGEIALNDSSGWF